MKKPIAEKVKGIAVLLMIGCVALTPHMPAQTAAGLLPMPAQFLDGSGRPLAGGTVDTFAAGTTSRLATFTDSTGAVENQNPVKLDSAGRASIWLGTGSYRVVVKASTGVTVLDMSGLTAPTLASSDLTVSSGHALNLQSGSTANLGADLIPNGSHTIGNSGHFWSAASITSLTLGNHLLLKASNSYDAGSSTTAFRNIYAFGSNVNDLLLCGTPMTLSSTCYALYPWADASNSYVIMADQASSTVMKWSRKEGGVTTNQVSAYMDLVPGIDNSFFLGTGTKRWQGLNIAGMALVGNLYLSGAGAHISTGGISGDVSGVISVSGSTSGTKTFSTVYNVDPICTVTPRSAPAGLTYWVAATASGITVNLSGSATIDFNYHCIETAH